MLKTENIQNIYRLSPMQEGLLFHSLYEKGSLSYFMRVVYYLQGDIDPDLSQRTLAILFQRHEILRTVFNFTKAKFPLQVTLKQWEPEFVFENISYLDPEQRNEYVQTFKQKDLDRGFDLTRDRLLRLALLQTGRREFVFILSHHHIILDGWSWNVLMEEYNKIYDALRNRKPYQLSAPIPYFKYIQFVEKQDKDADRAFWKQYVSDYNQVALIPKSKVNTAHAYAIKRIEYFIPPEKVRVLTELIQNAVVTLSTAIRVLWGIVLAKYNNNRDVIFGAVVSGRPASIDRVETMVGLFINTIPVRIRYNESTTFRELLQLAQQDFLAADKHSYSSVAEIQALSELKNQLMDHVLTFANFPSPYELEQNSQNEHMPGSETLKIAGFEVFDQTNYDFALTVIPGPKINIVFAFNEHVYDYDDMMRLGQRFEYIIDQVIAQPDLRIDDVEMILEDERMELQALNKTQAAYHAEKTLQEIFEQQVKLNPLQAAIVSGETTLSYAALNEQANKLAHHLRAAYNIQPNHPVGIMLGRSERVLISILAVLKAGGCYVFIDSAYPNDRLRYITANADVRCLILDSGDAFKVSFIERPMFAIDIELDMLDTSAEDPAPVNKPDDLAYIIYTSGSTGKPKGVSITHRSLLNTQCWRKEFYGFNERFVTLQFASFSFDSSVNDIFSMLLWGGGLVLLGETDRLSVGRINELLNKYSITNFNVVPGLYRSLVNDLESNGSLKLITLAGEKLTSDLVEKHFNKFPGVPIINEYGPTENAICSTAKKIVQATGGDPSIGKPISNTQVYVLDHSMKLLPRGLTGEIYISGDGLSKGYVHNEELNAARFLPHPFEAGKRIYRTGDLGRWNAENELEYLGRSDEQVKIRGYRVEPGEIESVMLQHPGITGAAVIVKGDPPTLVAFYAATNDINNDALFSYLSSQLPAYMVPANAARLDKIPVTINGKVDRKRLLELAENNTEEEGGGNEQPQTVEEKLLAEIWKEVLGRKAIGIHDNFFKSGGDSIKAIQIASRCYKAGYKLDVKDVFENATIEKLAKIIRPQVNVTDQEAVKGSFPLTPVQARFFESRLADMHHYNQTVMLSSPERLQPALIKAVFAKLAAHHDMLRATYDITASGVIQQIKSEATQLWFREFDLVDAENAEAAVRKHANDVQSGIDLEKGPLMRLALFHVKEGDLLLVAIHHLVMDTVSWRILLEDIEALYNQAKMQEPFSLPPKSDSFKKWSTKLKEYAASNRFLRESKYWNELVAASAPFITRDMDPADASNTLLDTDTVEFKLGSSLTEKLTGDVHAAFNTDINDILLLSVAKAVHQVWKLPNVMIDLEGHGRESILPDLNITRTVGWFTSIYPVCVPLNEAWDMQRQIIEAKDALHRVPNKGVGFGILKYLSPGEPDSAVRQFKGSSISFNYLGQFDADIANTSFSLAGHLMGRSMSQHQSRHYELEINGMILDGQLQVSIAYNRHHYNDTTIRRFADAFRDAIGGIAAYCLAQAEPVLTPSDLGCKEISVGQLKALQETYGAIEDVYPLTPSQEGFLFHYLRDRHSTAYFEQVCYRLQGELDAALVEKSMQMLTDRHAVLRTAFVYEDLDRPLQVLLKNRAVDFSFRNIESLAAEEQEAYLQECRESDRRNAFDLTARPLCRVILIQLSKDRFELVWSHHHIIMDGWCVVVITREFWQLYNHLKYGKPHGLAPVHPYKNYIQWLQARDTSDSKAYWNKYLSGYSQLTGIPGKKMQAGNKYISARVVYELNEQQTQSLNRLKEQHQVTLNTIMQAIWGLLLGKYNYTNDVLFGAIVSGRPTEIPGIENIIGLFINMIPVRVRFQPGQSFADLLKQLQAEALESEPHHYYPLPDVQAAAELKQQLLDHFMVFTNFPEGSEIENAMKDQDAAGSNNIDIADVEMFEHTNYDFNLVVVPNRKLKIEISFNQAAFDESWIRKIAGHIGTVIDQVAHEYTPISNISLFTEKDKDSLRAFNDTEMPYAAAETVCHRFARQAQDTPQAVALTCEYNSITYQELDVATAQLAGHMQQHFGIGKNDVVGVLLDRSAAMVTALLAVLRAGAAYLPLDPKLPESRIRFMLEDSGSKMVITQEEYRHLVLLENVLDIDNYPSNVTTDSLAGPHPDDLAYVIYTSGSTGKPKGVAVQHRALTNFLLSMQRRPGLLKTDSLLATTTYSFDISILEIFLPLVTGARTIIAKQAVIQDPYELQEMIAAVQPTVMQGTPTFWEMLINAGWKGNENMVILCGGEPLGRELAKKLLRLCASLWNMYGPTETTVWSCIKHVVKNAPVTIGKPIHNTKVYILDKDHHPLPAGLKGGIFIAGDGLAQGYLNQPQLTAQRYLPNPFKPGSMVYATGDMGSWTEDGEIICYGREDEQVKIRGHRIEPGEVESCMQEHPSIEKAVVVARKNEAGNYLAAYFTASAPLDKLALNRALMEKLPPYMIPEYLVQLDAFPVTAGGKIDKKALPEPGSTNTISREYVAPVNDIEKGLVQILEGVLDTKNIGRFDNFFELGGHSIKAIQAVSRIRLHLKAPVKLNDFFNYPRINELAAFIESLNDKAYAVSQQQEQVTADH